MQLDLTGQLQAAKAAATLTDPIVLVLGPDQFKVRNPVPAGQVIGAAQALGVMLTSGDDTSAASGLTAVADLIGSLIDEADQERWWHWVRTTCPTLDFLGTIMQSILQEATGRPLAESPSSAPPPPPLLPVSMAG